MSDVVVLLPLVEGTGQANAQKEQLDHLVQAMTQQATNNNNSAERSPSPAVAKIQFARSYVGDEHLASFFDGIGLVHRSFDDNKSFTAPAAMSGDNKQQGAADDGFLQRSASTVLNKGGALAWVRGIWAERYSGVHTLDLTCCRLTVGSSPLLVSLIKQLPKLQTLLLGDNFKHHTLPEGEGRHLLPEKSRFFCVAFKEDDKFTLNQKLVDPLLDAWRTHKHLATLRLDPWLVQGHAEWKAFTTSMRSRLRHEAFGARYQSAKEGKGAGLRARSVSTVVYQTMPVPDKVVKAATAASGIGGPATGPTSLRDRLIQVQVAEGKDREKINGREVMAREKLRQTIRGRSSSMILPLDQQNPATQGQDNDERSPPAGSTPVVSRPMEHGPFASLASLEDEIRLMLQQREFDARRKLMSRFHRR